MRENWDTYFMKMAIQASTRATCDRLHVGCVITRDRRVLATGYNGSLPGQPHCGGDNHLFLEGHRGCQRVLHAEANAVLQAAKMGIALDKSRAYVTTRPCFDCMKLLVGAGIEWVGYYQTYRDGPPCENTLAFGVPMEQVRVPRAWIEEVATRHFFSPTARKPEEA